MNAIYEICCGLDVHRDNIVACVMKGDLQSKPKSEIRTYTALRNGIKELKSWLEEEGCNHIAMESTGVYWKPVYAELEGSLEGRAEVLLVNAHNIKNVPGKKTDVKDSEWIAGLLRAGLLTGSFIPEKDVRELRDWTRYRKNMVNEISTQKNRIEKFLQSEGFKLSTFMSDVFGVSGKAILEHISESGTISIEELDLKLKSRLRKKKDEIALAVNGELSEHGKGFLKMQLKHLKQRESNLTEINETIDRYLEKFEIAVERLDGIPGISKVAASSIIGEIGIDMSKFSRVEKITSWAGVSPGCNESAGKKKSTKTTHGNPYIKSILCEVAWTVTRQRETYLSKWYWKTKQRRGAKKAIIGLARKILVIIYNLLLNKEAYNEQRFEQTQLKHSIKREKKMINELKKRGYKIEPMIA